MKKDFLVYRKKVDPNLFRIIINSTGKWEDVKIYEFHVMNFKVRKRCIAEKDDMLENSEVRKLFSQTTPSNGNWERVNDIEVFQTCLVCKEESCSDTCSWLSALMKAKNSTL